MSEFRHSHSLGQNFISDGNLLEAIVGDAGVTQGDTVVEIGAGMGSLTRKLAETGAKVLSFELDERLKPYLTPLEEKYPNLRVEFMDFMKYDLSGLRANSFKAVANLPYYITTPVLFRLLEDDRLSSVTVMVQEEVADRIIARPGGKDYGVLSVSAQLSGSVRITRRVGREMFNPSPNVDSAVIRLDRSKRPDEKVLKLVRAAFSMRRKTLMNCLAKAGYEKTAVARGLNALSFPPDVRGERLSPEDFEKLAGLIN